MPHTFCSGELFKPCYRSKAALGAPPSRRQQDKSNPSLPAQTQGAEHGYNKARGYSYPLAGETPALPGRPSLDCLVQSNVSPYFPDDHIQKYEALGVLPTAA